MGFIEKSLQRGEGVRVYCAALGRFINRIFRHAITRSAKLADRRLAGLQRRSVQTYALGCWLCFIKGQIP
jgi:hypothetical protein